MGVEVDHHGRLLAGVGVHLHLARHQHRAALVREDGELRARGELVPDQSALFMTRQCECCSNVNLVLMTSSVPNISACPDLSSTVTLSVLPQSTSTRSSSSASRRKSFSTTSMEKLQSGNFPMTHSLSYVKYHNFTVSGKIFKFKVFVFTYFSLISSFLSFVLSFSVSLLSFFNSLAIHTCNTLVLVS